MTWIVKALTPRKRAEEERAAAQYGCQSTITSSPLVNGGLVVHFLVIHGDVDAFTFRHTMHWVHAHYIRRLRGEFSDLVTAWVPRICSECDEAVVTQALSAIDEAQTAATRSTQASCYVASSHGPPPIHLFFLPRQIDRLVNGFDSIQRDQTTTIRAGLQIFLALPNTLEITAACKPEEMDEYTPPHCNAQTPPFTSCSLGSPGTHFATMHDRLRSLLVQWSVNARQVVEGPAPGMVVQMDLTPPDRPLADVQPTCASTKYLNALPSETLETLRTIVKNLRDDVDNLKFRQLACGSERFQTVIRQHPGAMAVLRNIGFVHGVSNSVSSPEPVRELSDSDEEAGSGKRPERTSEAPATAAADLQALRVNCGIPETPVLLIPGESAVPFMPEIRRTLNALEAEKRRRNPSPRTL